MINQKLSQWANRHNQLLNTVDQAQLGNSYFGAIINRYPLTIAISSGGLAPLVGNWLRRHLETIIPHRYGDLATLYSHFRHRLKKILPQSSQRRRFWQKQLDQGLPETVLKGDIKVAEQYLHKQLLSPSISSVGKVYLVGCGPGDPELLTLKALHLLQQADIVFYDRLVNTEILGLVRREAKQINVGKSCGQRSISQDQINNLLYTSAQKGLSVLRLKGGDPFIFGRAGEELAYLAQHDIAYQVIPGITAASGCAAYAGIPLTHRDYSQSVHFITAHKHNGKLNLDWQQFVKEGQTLVFYMALNALPTICSQLIYYGMSKDMLSAFIARGTTTQQQILVASISKLADKISRSKVQTPALLIVGDVVKYYSSKTNT